MGKDSDVASVVCAPQSFLCVLGHWSCLENRIFFSRTCTKAGPQQPRSPVGCLWQAACACLGLVLSCDCWCHSSRQGPRNLEASFPLPALVLGKVVGSLFFSCSPHFPRSGPLCS